MEDIIAVKSHSKVEWVVDRVEKKAIWCDGSEIKSMVLNTPRTEVANWAEGKEPLVICSQVMFTFGGNSRVVDSRENWKLNPLKSKLIIHQVVDSSKGYQETYVGL